MIKFYQKYNNAIKKYQDLVKKDMMYKDLTDKEVMFMNYIEKHFFTGKKGEIAPVASDFMKRKIIKKSMF